jgi:hypothetical protein
VYRVTDEPGAFGGRVALTQRFRQCRRGYSVEFDGRAEPILRLSDGSVVPVADLSAAMASFVEQSGRAAFGADSNR